MLSAAGTWLMQALGGAISRGSGAMKDWRCFLDGVEVVGPGLRPPEMEQAGGAKFLELAPPPVACCK